MDRTWISRDEVLNSSDWVVNNEMGVARKRGDPPEKVYFLCDKKLLNKAAETRREPNPTTKYQKHVMQPAHVEVNINGNMEKMSIMEFRKKFAKWLVKAPTKDDPSMEDLERDRLAAQPSGKL
jgi:hypothetical protein